MNEKKNDKAYKTAIVDIGSNTVRISIYDLSHPNPTVILSEKVNCKLSKHLDANQNITDQGFTIINKTLKLFKLLADEYQVSKILAFATEAVRSANNKNQLLLQAKDLLGATPLILNGEEEAYTSSLGVLHTLPNVNGNIIDLGGGSLEIASVKKGKIYNSLSLPIGTLKIAKDFEKDLEAARFFLRQYLKSNVKNLSNKKLYLVGGNCRSLAKIIIESTNYPIKLVHGFNCLSNEVLHFANKIINGRIPEKGFSEVSNSRISTLPIAALIISEVITLLKPDKIIFSAAGIREGSLQKFIKEHNPSNIPTVVSSAQSVRKYSAYNAQRELSLFNWTKKLAKVLSLNETPHYKNLRLAACTLSPCSQLFPSGYRGHHTANFVLNSNLLGLDHFGRLYVALICLTHNQAKSLDQFLAINDLCQDNKLTEKKINQAISWGLALQLADTISGKLFHIIDKIEISVNNKGLNLIIPAKYSYLATDKLQKKLNNYANAIKFTNSSILCVP